MFSERDLSAEIRALIEKKIETAKRPINPEWIAHEIIQRRKPPEEWSGEAADFYRHCTYNHVRSRVRDVVRAFGRTQEDFDERTLPLFPGSFVQRAYSILRRGKSVIVRVEAMTDREIEQKAGDLERLAFGARRHARELRRYVRTRPSRRRG
jgi:hypothetical protein